LPTNQTAFHSGTHRICFRLAPSPGIEYRGPVAVLSPDSQKIFMLLVARL
jgi:hypothetical protein